MTEYLNLDYCADTRLSEEQAWRGARIVSGVIFDQLIEGAPDPNEACFVIRDADEVLCGVSAQPDLTGPMRLRFEKIEGLWLPNRRQYHDSYQGLRQQPRLQADHTVLTVWHQKNNQQLLSVALPMDPQSAQLLRYGQNIQCGVPSYEALAAVDCHDADDVMLYPRHVQAAAWLTREVIQGGTVPLPVYSSNTMRARVTPATKDAQYELSQIPVFTV